MTAKLKPGESFSVEIQGEVFRISVMSVGDKIAAEDALQSAIDAKSGYTRARLTVVEKHSHCTSASVPLGDILSESMLTELWEAVLWGNEPTDDELKN